MVTPDEHPKVADFGLAKLVDENSLSLAGDLVGTYFYMSPEQVASKRAGLDHRTDIFSLGVVLYEMLTLVRPFEGDTTEQVAHKILVVDPPTAREVRSKVPLELAVICGKAMEKDRDQRYGSMAELAADLRRHLANEPILARPPTVGQRAVKWARRNPTVSVAAAVAAVAMVVIGWLGLVAMKSADEARLDKAATEAALLQVEEARVTIQAALVTAEHERGVAQRKAYAANIFAVRAAIELGNVTEARGRLEMCPEGLRGWEFDNLMLRLDSSLLKLQGHGGSVYSVAWEPGGVRVASGSYDGQVRIWSGVTGDALEVLPGSALLNNLGPLNTLPLAWDPNGGRLAAGTQDGEVRIWDLDEQVREHRLLEGHESPVMAISWSSGGDWLASGSLDERIRVWDVETGKVVQEFYSRNGAVLCVSFDPEGRRLATCGGDNLLCIWDVQTGKLLQAIHPDWSSGARCIAWDPGGSRLVVGSGQGMLHVFDANEGELLRRVRTSGSPNSPVISVAWSSCGTELLSGSDDKTVRVWSADDLALLRTLPGHENSVNSVGWSSAGAHIVSGSSDGSVRIWERATGEPVRLQLGEGLTIRGGMEWNPAGTHLALVSGMDRLVRIWDARTGLPEHELSGHMASPFSLSWEPGGSRLVTCSLGGEMRIWDGETGEELGALEGPGLYHRSSPTGVKVHSVAWAPTGAWIATGGWDGRVGIWDWQTGESLRVLEGHGARVRSLAWDPGSSRLISGAEDGTLMVWDGETGDLLGGPLRHGEQVMDLAWAPGGEGFASGSSDGTLRVWDVATMEPVHTLSGHEGTVRAVDWHPSGNRIVSGGDGGSLRIWEAQTGEALQVLVETEKYVNGVAWDPTGRRIASVSNFKFVRLWETDLEDAVGMWRVASAHQKIRARVDTFFEDHVDLEEVLDAVHQDASLSADQRLQALRFAIEVGKSNSRILNDQAWELVDPDRRNKGSDVALGLRLARVVVDLQTTQFALRDTLAWALFANGLHDEALVESAKALELADEAGKDDYQGYLDRMRAMIKEARSNPPTSDLPGDDR
jgi:WD40 repeat protein